MRKVTNLMISGVSLATSGIIILVSDKIGIDLSKILVPTLIVVSGVFAIQFASINREVKVAYQYHIIQGIVFIIFGLIIGFGAKNLNVFLKYATYFIIFLGLFDIIYGFALVNSNYNWTWEKLLFKSFGGFLGLIGGVAILATSITNQHSGLMITGIMTTIMGIGTIDFATKLKTIST